MKNGKFGCAVWGCGWVASGHINAYLKHPACEVVTLGSRRLESVQAKQAEFGLDCRATTDFNDILNDDRIDIVCKFRIDNGSVCLAASGLQFTVDDGNRMAEAVQHFTRVTLAGECRLRVGFITGIKEVTLCLVRD